MHLQMRTDAHVHTRTPLAHLKRAHRTRTATDAQTHRWRQTETETVAEPFFVKPSQRQRQRQRASPDKTANLDPVSLTSRFGFHRASRTVDSMSPSGPQGMSSWRNSLVVLSKQQTPTDNDDTWNLYSASRSESGEGKVRAQASPLSISRSGNNVSTIVHF